MARRIASNRSSGKGCGRSALMAIDDLGTRWEEEVLIVEFEGDLSILRFRRRETFLDIEESFENRTMSKRGGVCDAR